MNFSELVQETMYRGFDYLDQSTAFKDRVKRWVNQGMHELCEQRDWPFLETSTTGTAPLAFTNLRAVQDVKRADGTLLAWRHRQTLSGLYGSLSTTGTPSFWYLEGDTLKTYPVKMDESLSVRYIEVPSNLSADDDEPVVPSRYHNLIVDAAVIRAYRDSDNYEAAIALREEWNSEVASMAYTLMHRNRTPEYVELHGDIAVEGQW